MSISQLSSIIKNERFQKIENSAAVLFEPDKISNLNSIVLKNIPIETIILKSDEFHLDTIFNEGKPFSKRCDFIILTSDTIYFLELKSHERAPKVKFNDVNFQFKTVECIIDLIDSVIFRFSKINFRLNNLNKKFFLFYHNPTLAKTRTSLKDSYKFYQPNSSENFYSIPVINGEEIYFDEIK